MIPRLQLLGAAAVLWAASVGGASWYAYGKGKAHEQQAQAAQDLAALFGAVRRVGEIGEAIAALGRDLADAIAASRKSEAASVRTVGEVIRANPDFGAVRRPDGLQRLRRQELEAIARAAEAHVVRRPRD